MQPQVRLSCNVLSPNRDETILIWMTPRLFLQCCPLYPQIIFFSCWPMMQSLAPCHWWLKHFRLSRCEHCDWLVTWTACALPLAQCQLGSASAHSFRRCAGLILHFVFFCTSFYGHLTLFVCQSACHFNSLLTLEERSICAGLKNLQRSWLILYMGIFCLFDLFEWNSKNEWL